MTENSLSGRPGYGRTFSTAMWVVGSIAIIQLLALGFGVARRAPVITMESAVVKANEAFPPAPPVPPAPVPAPGAPAPGAAPASADLTAVVQTWQGQPLFDALGRPVPLRDPQ